MSFLRQSYCPRCFTYLVYTTDDKILCPACRLAFNKNLLELVDDDNILSDKEIMNILDSLKDMEGI
jgi:hypothetical protein